MLTFWEIGRLNLYVYIWMWGRCQRHKIRHILDWAFVIILRCVNINMKPAVSIRLRFPSVVIHFVQQWILEWCWVARRIWKAEMSAPFSGIWASVFLRGRADATGSQTTIPPRCTQEVTGSNPSERWKNFCVSDRLGTKHHSIAGCLLLEKSGKTWKSQGI